MTTSGRRRLITELSERSEELGDRVLTRMRAEIPLYARDGPGTFIPAAVTALRGVLLALREDRAFTEPELAGFASYGEQRARQGIPVEEMQRAWRLSTREVVDEMIAAGRRLRVGDRVLLQLTRDLLAVADTATLAFTQGHHRAELELARHDQQRRTDFVRGVLHALLGPAEIRAQSRHWGLDPDQDYHPIRVRLDAATSPESFERTLGLATGSSRPGGLTALLDGDLAGFVTRPPTVASAAVIGAGPAARLDHLEPAFRHATRAMATASAFGLTGVHDLAGLGLLPAVLSDTDVGDALVSRYVTAVGAGDAAAAVLDTVRTYLSLGMRADLTADRMTVHHNTVRYRLRRYEELTGVDLRDPDRALEAWWALQRLRLDPPAPAGP